MLDARVHVLVVTMGSAGDLFPFLRLALDLQAAGQRVTVVAPLMHEPWVRQGGLAFHGLPADPAVLADPDLWHARRGFGVVWRAVQPGIEGVAQFLQRLPAAEACLMVAHPLVLPHADLYRVLRPGLRIVGAYLAPSNLRTVHDPLLFGPWAVPRWMPLGLRAWLWRRIEAHLINPVALPGLNRERRTRGLAPASGLLDLMQNSADLSVTLFPAWFGPPQPDWPQPLCMGEFALYDPHPDTVLPDALQAFLGTGAAPLVFTPGTGNLQAQAYFRHALGAVAESGYRAIFLTPHREQLPAVLPDSVLWIDYVPLRLLLPHVAALIHHGGIGTTAEALRAGIPQLIVALAYDQFDNGARVQRLGAGCTMHASSLTQHSLAKMLRGMLNDSAVISRWRGLPSHAGSANAKEGVINSISKLISETGKI